MPNTSYSTCLIRAISILYECVYHQWSWPQSVVGYLRLASVPGCHVSMSVPMVWVSTVDAAGCGVGQGCVLWPAWFTPVLLSSYIHTAAAHGGGWVGAGVVMGMSGGTCIIMSCRSCICVKWTSLLTPLKNTVLTLMAVLTPCDIMAWFEEQLSTCNTSINIASKKATCWQGDDESFK